MWEDNQKSKRYNAIITDTSEPSCTLYVQNTPGSNNTGSHNYDFFEIQLLTAEVFVLDTVTIKNIEIKMSKSRWELRVELQTLGDIYVLAPPFESKPNDLQIWTIFKYIWWKPQRTFFFSADYMTQVICRHDILLHALTTTIISRFITQACTH